VPLVEVESVTLIVEPTLLVNINFTLFAKGVSGRLKEK
jgi:hypothetical protein